eukprot:TRINITY_DN57153_c0_g1_i1.p1 TRINITY_DN57153_c0_g1~~TRINITY_DN57153_c0_g1_i1.p1  ORF type:complete len:801 (-),score=242.71 TRINITY_DN57153_c0_g1_i1:174-2576(-)
MSDDEEAYATFARPGSSRLDTGQSGVRKQPGLQSSYGQPQAAPGSSMGDARPMTSNRAAGFKTKVFDPLGDAVGTSQAPPLEKRTDRTPEEQCLEMEKKVNALIEQSAVLAARGDYSAALEKAKESEKRERALGKMRDQRGLSEQANIDLTYCVQFNLAVQYHNNQLYNDAINTYTAIVRNKQYAMAARLKVNMGNIYYEWRRYSFAIKMYKQALEAIPPTGRDVRFKVMRNIGNALVRLGQFQDAIASYEAIFEAARERLDASQPAADVKDIKAAFNLLLCYYAVGDRDKMKRAFTRLLEVRFYQAATAGLDDDEWAVDDPEFRIVNKNEQGLGQQSDHPKDALRLYLRDKREEHNALILTAARLIAPVIEKDWTYGFDHVIEALRHFERQTMASSRLAAEVEMARGLEFLRHNKFSKAIDALRAFEKKDSVLKARAATNLSYLYFLEGDHDNGEKYAVMAVDANKFSAKALVNLGNFAFARGDFERAKHCYLRALKEEMDSVEAQYNLGLTMKKTSHYREALSAFEKLHVLIPESVEVLYQIAHTYELIGHTDEAKRRFEDLRARVPTDPTILSHLGSMNYGADGTEQAAVDYYVEAYRYLPVDLDVISWLGAYFVRIEVYEKAMAFFERAAQIQPQEVKWQLLVANCHRRLHQYPQAKRLYEAIHRRHPGNIECLRYLVHLCQDMGHKEEGLEWHRKMKKLEDKQTGGHEVLDQEHEEEQEVDMAELAGLLGDKAVALGLTPGPGAEGGAAGAASPGDGEKKRSAAERRADKKASEEKAKEKDDDMELDLDEMLPGG